MKIKKLKINIKKYYEKWKTDQFSYREKKNIMNERDKKKPTFRIGAEFKTIQLTSN